MLTRRSSARALTMVVAIVLVGAACDSSESSEPPVAVDPESLGGGCPVGLDVTLVTSCDRHGWEFQEDGAASVRFASGPGTPPSGLGSVEFDLGNDGDDGAEVGTNAFAGLRLADITGLSYRTFVQAHPGGANQAPFLTLSVDLDGDGTQDDEFVFAPDAAAVVVGQWQSWDAVGAVAPYVGANPDATIVDASLGGVRLGAGFGWPPGFVGNADVFIINGETFDFDVV